MEGGVSKESPLFCFLEAAIRRTLIDAEQRRRGHDGRTSATPAKALSFVKEASREKYAFYRRG
jgi:hypothetical protein